MLLHSNQRTGRKLIDPDAGICNVTSDPIWKKRLGFPSGATVVPHTSNPCTKTTFSRYM